MRSSWPQSCKCERLAGSDGGTMLVEFFLGQSVCLKQRPLRHLCSILLSFFLSLILFHLLTGFLKPQCSLAPPMQRGRSGEACSCFSGVCPLHQRRLSTGNNDCVH